MRTDAQTAFARYEDVRPALPDADFPRESERVAHLGSLIERFDTFLLDAFGVLNIGDTAIPGATEFIAAIRRAGKRVMVVSNSASVPTCVSHEKFRRLGFDFAPEEIVTSRDALKVALAAEPRRRWGIMAAETSQIEELGVDAHALVDAEDAYESAEGFILLGSAGWSEERQDRLARHLDRRPRPVLVGNPDLVAPREDGLSLEPGWFAHDLAARCDCRPVFFGKPFGNVFDLALSRIGTVDPARTVMVGDTLHTDVLGGVAAGLRGCLLCDYGLLAGQDVDALVSASGIRPHFIVDAL